MAGPELLGVCPAVSKKTKPSCWQKCCAISHGEKSLQASDRVWDRIGTRPKMHQSGRRVNFRLICRGEKIAKCRSELIELARHDHDGFANAGGKGAIDLHSEGSLAVAEKIDESMTVRQSQGFRRQAQRVEGLLERIEKGDFLAMNAGDIADAGQRARALDDLVGIHFAINAKNRAQFQLAVGASLIFERAGSGRWCRRGRCGSENGRSGCGRRGLVRRRARARGRGKTRCGIGGGRWKGRGERIGGSRVARKGCGDRKRRCWCGVNRFKAKSTRGFRHRLKGAGLDFGPGCRNFCGFTGFGKRVFRSVIRDAGKRRLWHQRRCRKGIGGCCILGGKRAEAAKWDT